MKTHSSIHKGDTGVAYVIATLLEHGFKVCTPVSMDSKYDIVIDVNNNFKRIQIRSLYEDSTKKYWKLTCQKVRFNTKKTWRSKYTATDIDFFIGVCLETKDLFIIPINNATKIDIHIRKDGKNYNEYRNNFDLLS